MNDENINTQLFCVLGILGIVMALFFGVLLPVQRLGVEKENARVEAVELQKSRVQDLVERYIAVESDADIDALSAYFASDLLDIGSNVDASSNRLGDWDRHLSEGKAPAGSVLVRVPGYETLLCEVERSVENSYGWIIVAIHPSENAPPGK